MSTIKSSDEHLTINADGSGKEIKLQNNGSESVAITSTGVGIGVTNVSVFNGVGGTSKLVIKGSDTATAIANNSDASLTIANDDGTAGNLAGLHFARADTDDNPHYAGASIVAQFSETQVTGQYPKGELAFLTSTSANTAPSEKMRILAAGGLTFNGDTAAANALDDYEEGTWTPSFQNVTVTTYDQLYGYYTKIGNRVFFDGICSASNIDNTDGSAISIGGLPFTISDNTEAYPSVSLFPEDGVGTGDNRPMGLGVKDSTHILIYKFTPGTGDNPTFLNYSNCGSALRFRFSGHYLVS